ncbi:hypothetical protein FDI23_gp086 [Serratia phage CHI14]|uniref:Thioredoxin n=2 Tax=Winklervirus chi14 TaxID=2560752 RepID=A0A1Z1LY67_9CAUD|nr:hypothetical protein FDI23_gp086 [Serratia phage CHI14]ARW57509.1 hypothetical protein [Serratia phage CHI14]ARW57784.1 hypothetical protein [Serratia phage CBH8]
MARTQQLIDNLESSGDEEVFEIDWKACMEMVDRRENACKQVSPCPECDSMQVQLVDWRTDVLKMKCRHCKHKFEKELK